MNQTFREKFDIEPLQKFKRTYLVCSFRNIKIFAKIFPGFLTQIFTKNPSKIPPSRMRERRRSNGGNGLGGGGVRAVSATQPPPAQQQPQSPPAQLGKVASASSMDGMAMGSSNGNGTNGNEVIGKGISDQDPRDRDVPERAIKNEK